MRAERRNRNIRNGENYQKRVFHITCHWKFVSFEYDNKKSYLFWRRIEDANNQPLSCQPLTTWMRLWEDQLFIFKSFCIHCGCVSIIVDSRCQPSSGSLGDKHRGTVGSIRWNYVRSYRGRCGLNVRCTFVIIRCTKQ